MLVNRALMGLLGILVLGLGACAERVALLDNRAPQNQNEAGVIVQITSQANTLLEASESYRVINEDHGLYEVRGLSITEIKKVVPHAQAETNLYFQQLIEEAPDHSAYEPHATHPSNIANNGTSLPPALVGCELEPALRPLAAIRVNTAELRDSITMELGQMAQFDGEQSRVTATQRTLHELRWDIVPPRLSQLPRGQVQTGSDLEFKPDMVGVYQVILVAQDSEGACGLQMLRFLVTDNPSLDTSLASDREQDGDLSRFSHLQKVQAPLAWERASGKNIIVAVLDTGLHYNHPAIKQNLALNSLELDGIAQTDNDNNGFKNDFLGWDFVNDDNKPFDDHGHGSHVAGLIASNIYGLAREAQIMPIKVLNAAGGGDTASIVAGIYYAVDNGAHIINASLQRINTQLQSLKQAIAYAHSKNVIVVTSAGNDNLNLTLPGMTSYPGQVDEPNVVNVAALGNNNQLTPYSNYGVDVVHVAAPGGDQEEPIYSLAPANPGAVDFIPSGGTSMAAPIVAGVIAQMLEVSPYMHSEQARILLMEAGPEVQGLKNYVSSGRIISASTALDLASELHQQNHMF
jgi:subtilisin family serine protease